MSTLRLRSVTLAALVVLLAGCAGMRDRSAYQPVAMPDADRATVDQDDAYIAKVEQTARMRGIGVTWVNPPHRRRVASTPR